jgi:hypothetical protein
MVKFFFQLFLLLALISNVFTVRGQQTIFDNIIVFEHFTNASCGPCAAQNPAFQAVLANNTDKATSVKYHVNWPGIDPMYSFNPTDPMDRRAFYGITGVPSVRLSNQPNMSPSGINNTVINQLYTAVQPAFNYNISTRIENDSLFVSGQVVRFRPLNLSNMRLHLAVVEDPVNYATPPGSNGEKDFASVVRKMLPNAQGTQLGNGATAVNFNFAYPIPTVLDQSRLYLVAFVQDHDTQTAYRGVKIKAGSSFATSTAELSTKSLQVWPNPTNHLAQIRWDTPTNAAELVVRGLDGRIFHSRSLTPNEVAAQIVDLSLAEYAAGIYFVQLITSENIFQSRLVRH